MDIRKRKKKEKEIRKLFPRTQFFPINVSRSESLFKIWRNENWIKGRFLHKARGISLRQVTPRNYLLSRKWPACASTWLGRPFSTSPLHPLQLNPPTIKSIKHAPFMPMSLCALVSNTLTSPSQFYTGGTVQICRSVVKIDPV